MQRNLANVYQICTIRLRALRRKMVAEVTWQSYEKNITCAPVPQHVGNVHVKICFWNVLDVPKRIHDKHLRWSPKYDASIAECEGATKIVLSYYLGALSLSSIQYKLTMFSFSKTQHIYLFPLPRHTHTSIRDVGGISCSRGTLSPCWTSTACSTACSNASLPHRNTIKYEVTNMQILKLDKYADIKTRNF